MICARRVITRYELSLQWKWKKGQGYKQSPIFLTDEKLSYTFGEAGTHSCLFRAASEALDWSNLTRRRNAFY